MGNQNTKQIAINQAKNLQELFTILSGLTQEEMVFEVDTYFLPKFGGEEPIGLQDKDGRYINGSSMVSWDDKQVLIRLGDLFARKFYIIDRAPDEQFLRELDEMDRKNWDLFEIFGVNRS